MPNKQLHEHAHFVGFMSYSSMFILDLGKSKQHMNDRLLISPLFDSKVIAQNPMRRLSDTFLALILNG